MWYTKKWTNLWFGRVCSYLITTKESQHHLQCGGWRSYQRLLWLIYLFTVATGLLCCVRAFSSHGEQGLLPSCSGFLLLWLRSLQSSGSRVYRLQQMRHAGSVVVPHRHVGYSWTRDWTRVSCIDRWILNHWATREAPGFDSNSDD